MFPQSPPTSFEAAANRPGADVKALAEKNQVALLGQIPLVQSIRESGDSGRPAVMNNDLTSEAFKEFAEAVAQHVSIRNAQLEQTKRVEIKI